MDKSACSSCLSGDSRPECRKCWPDRDHNKLADTVDSLLDLIKIKMDGDATHTQ